MTTSNSPSEALAAYLKLLQKNSTSRVDMSLKEHFAQQLIANLPRGTQTPATYRLAVDAMLDSLPPEYKNDAVLVAREFFPFLMSDVKSVVALMRSGGYRGFASINNVLTDNNIQNIQTLLSKAMAQAFSSQRISVYDKYLATLRARRVPEMAIAMRGRLAKILLYLCHDRDVAPSQYRAAVDSVIPLLPKDEARMFFVLIAREFYHFLIMADDAPTKIRVDSSYPSGDLLG